MQVISALTAELQNSLNHFDGTRTRDLSSHSRSNSHFATTNNFTRERLNECVSPKEVTHLSPLVIGFCGEKLIECFFDVLPLHHFPFLYFISLWRK